MNITTIQTRRFRERDNLASFVRAQAKKLRDGDILVVTSKIVSLAEARTASLAEKDRLMKAESTWIMPGTIAPISLKNGLFMAFAGIDESNADGKIILLPRDSYAAAARLRKILMRSLGFKNLGVLITDSHVSPLRAGVVGIALGYAGFKGLKEYRGSPDIFGRIMRMSRVNVADCLASAAVLLMGEGQEQTPLAIIRNVPVEFAAKTDAQELSISIEDDLYAPILKAPRRSKKTGH